MFFGKSGRCFEYVCLQSKRSLIFRKVVPLEESPGHINTDWIYVSDFLVFKQGFKLLAFRDGKNKKPTILR
ncbi:hypothetical protein C660_11521 [Alcaligenes sp. HPC1271]|nr:hypothetical protein C660_11521 [Alcaligenes sp. HPC1271]